MEDAIKIGISSCLLGNQVRYDSGHCRDGFLTDTLGRYVEFVPVCPEVECGLPVPRPAMHLRGDPGNPRLVTTRTGTDHTGRMKNWARGRLEELAREDLCGFIFKKNSPSSGMARVKVYDETGRPSKKGSGIFAGMFMKRFPLIPVEEEGRLNDPLLRENFIEQIFTLKRWRDCRKKGLTMGNLVDFHTRNKLLIRSHSEKHYTAMGRIVARGKKISPTERCAQYEELLLGAMRCMATVRRHTNVMQHMLGYFKKSLTRDEKQEMLEVIDTYRRGYVPLIVPLTLFGHYVRKYDSSYLKQQTYLNPHSVALKLRNHA